MAEKRVDFSYNGLGQFTEIARFKDTDGGTAHEIATSTYTYDTLHRLTGLAYKKSGTNLFTPYAYTFDALSNRLPLPLTGTGRTDGPSAAVTRSDPRVAALARGAVFAGAGRITQMTSADGTSAYTYDKTSQLTAADHSYQSDETYSYDANGNRTMTGYSTGPNNQLLADGTYTYEYDGEGNRIRREKTADGSSTEYAWDFRNRLVSVTDKDSLGDVVQVVGYTYDVFNRRISRAVDTTSPFDLADAAVERYVLDDLHGVTSLDGGNVVLDFVDPDGTGSASLGLAKRYLYGNAVDQILAQEDVTQGISDADRVYWPLVDHLGTVRDLYQNDATSAQHYKYDSFGTVTAGNSALSRYLYTARELDPATDLQYNRARWLHGAVWISNDPIGFASGSANLIQYTLNRPLITSDASGLAPPVDFSTMSLAEIIGYYRQQVPAVTQSSTNLPPADWAWTPWSRSSVLDGIPTIYLQRIPSVAVKVNVTASQLITYYSNTSGAAPGPMGCGPCTGAIVYPTYAPADMPTPNRWGPVYVFHLSPGAALPDITLPSQSYSAVINGVIPTTPTDLYSRSHLYTLSQMIAFLRQRRVRIVGYTPVSSIHLYDGTVYLGAPPGFNPN